MFPVALVVLLSVVFDASVYAAPGRRNPGPASSAGQTIPLLSRREVNRTYDEWGEWARGRKEGLLAKYGSSSSVTKRGAGTNLITNQNEDSSYFGSLAIGTPPVAFNVILDTGSADLWIADSGCTSGCDNVPLFEPTASSSFTNLSRTFSITYGSGAASGILATETIQMAGFSVQNQTLGICDRVSSGLLDSPVSGLLGLGFETIAASRATPFWETLVQGGAWDSPVMSFQLTRFRNVNKATDIEAGGTFTMGFVNESLYTGDIDYVDIPDGQETYWTLPLTEITVNGNGITVPSGSSSYSAIDTGTTLVGGPSDVIAELYAQIPDSVAGTGNYDGYWFFPCTTEVIVAMSFGSKSWNISAEDFTLTSVGNNQCLGAFFEINISGSAPSWIVGDTFLKNVYSVFRYNPASVGFAELSDTALAMSNVDSPVPTPTLGSVQAGVTATNTADRASSNGAWSTIRPPLSSVASSTSVLVITLLVMLCI